MRTKNIKFFAAIPMLAVVWGCGGEPIDEPSQQTQAASMKGPNIVELALKVNAEGAYAGTFDTLIAALLTADPQVIGTLSGKGKYTVFAPTDDAFAALGLNPSNIGTLDNTFLSNVLLYHVAPGERFAEDVVSSERIRTLYKDFLFSSPSAELTDALGRKANILLTDIAASNGVIHVIDAVVLPYAP